jgi:thioredoxin reductase
MITDPQPPSLIVAILGAGPAGMSCANACLSFGLTPVVIERGDHAGGAQRANFHPNLWMLGAPGESGETMTRRMAEHYTSLPVQTRYRTEVAHVEGKGAGFNLTFMAHGGSPDPLHARAIVLATGMRPRATPELEQLAGASRGVIIGPLSDTIRDGIRDARVLILGGGDNALDHALFWQRTSSPGIYAAGDITDSPQPSVPTAIIRCNTADAYCNGMDSSLLTRHRSARLELSSTSHEKEGVRDERYSYRPGFGKERLPGARRGP